MEFLATKPNGENITFEANTWKEALNKAKKAGCYLTTGNVSEGEDVIWCPTNEEGQILLDECSTIPYENDPRKWVQLPPR